jgi:DNA-binding MarR family transcriptional regulator
MKVKLGVTGPQRLVIRLIGRFPSIHAGQLAAMLYVHPSSLTALLKRLERRKLITRRRDERDRRRSKLGLTKVGQTLNRQIPETVEAAVERTLRANIRRDLDGARTVLTRLAHELGTA